MKRLCGLLVIVAAMGLTAYVATELRAGEPGATQQESKGEAKGRCRIHYYGPRGEVRQVEGETWLLPDGSYEVAVQRGMTVKIRKNQIKAVVALEAESTGEPRGGETTPSASGFASRRPITDAEIEEILKDITAAVDETVTGVKLEDLEAELPLNVESVKEMFRHAGLTWKEGVPPEKQENLLIKPHFVMVYTSPAKAARQLGSRLEAVWTWNVRFLRMLKVPARRPEYKLEIYYFGRHEEFKAYAVAQGHGYSPGILGYYMPPINRSHFFEMETWPPVARYLEQLKQIRQDSKEAAAIKNRVARWVEYQNMEVIQHETGHHIHFNIGLFPRNGLERESSIPVWLVEGTTMMFEFPPTQAGASLGVLNHNRLHQFREQLRASPLTAQDWKLFLIDNNMWYTGMGRGMYSYPLGWAMVYYLWKEKREEYAKYLQTVFGREEDFRMTPTEREKEFEDIFGVVDEEWVKKFYKFMDSLVLKPSLLPPDIH